MREQTELGSLLTDDRTSALSKYREVTVGKRGNCFLLFYEILTFLLGPLPGAMGMVLRGVFYQGLFRKLGRRVVIGRNVTIRHPKKISIGDRTVIDDNCVLDAKGSSSAGIVIGKSVLLSRNTILSCKNGSIRIGDNSNVGTNCLIHSETEVHVGAKVLVAAYCYLVAGGNHDHSRTDIPVIEQRSITKGGIRLGNNVWLGARVTVIDGVKIGRDAIVGAGAVVTRDIAEFTINTGVPARQIRKRTQPEGGGSA